MSTELPLVSLIVPIYNVQDYLDRCIESLLQQTFDNIEIILVDDGSTDNSGVIADQYASSYDNVSVIHKNNGGLSSARNQGLKMARGEWVAFVDSDDYIGKEYVQKLIKLASITKSDIAACNKSTIRLDGTESESIIRWPNGVLTGKEAAKEKLNNNWPSQIWLLLIKKKIFTENNIVFPIGREYESTAVIPELFYYSRLVAFTNEKLYYYAVRGNSISRKPFTTKTYEDKLAVIKDTDDFLRSQNVENLYYYFKYCLINSIFNDISRSPTKIDDENIWLEVRKQLKDLYPKVEFPNMTTKIKRGIALLLSSNETLYRKLHKILV